MDNIEEICRNSYRDFHVKGFDYLCLTRRPELTRKVYFFEGNLSQLPELVVPHDHRYDFQTTVLSGSLINKRYTDSLGPNPKGDVQTFNEFEYMTPLNGGDGFSWKRETEMVCIHRHAYNRGGTYFSLYNSIHTLDILQEGTVILLEQGRDLVPENKPTRAFKTESREAPSLDGLYDRMTPDHAKMRIEQFLSLAGNW